MPKVTLDRPSAEDVPARQALGFSAEIRRMYGADPATVPEMSPALAKAWFDALAEHPCAWVIRRDGRLVGQARLDDIDHADGRARLAIGLLSEEELGRGLGRAAVRLVLEHAFGVLGLNRVDLRVLAYNTRAIRCYAACGFVEEGRERQAARVAGEWHDDVIMGILRSEYLVDAGHVVERPPSA